MGQEVSGESFEELRKCLISVSVLVIPQGTERVVINSDLSEQGLGCVLMQNGKVIVYAFHQLI